ncbi:hypothetical protein LGQ03_07135 [Loktanella sp. TSTF-M6]|uniref:Uncharacterized protein n=1 Tax=Loktanella gaetbuli TaxID=2881335 RepID=A0ABS8BTD7_9RHOB|nr:hypothetical protein [Loktanella gaetbuli]MCB5199009.1 hypothetical protein [Loktanella gaetbuli]
MTTVQPTKMPTNKSLTMAGGTILLNPLIQPAVSEVWPQIAPTVLAGENMTTLVGAALAAGISLFFAWFVPDRPNIRR